jgi:CelD/BcsL family acetyltransferase involved in cellulose biosynthesis
VSDVEGGPVMLVPLGIESRHGLRMLLFLDRGVCDYNAPITFCPIDPEGMRLIWVAICEAAPSFDVALLEKIPRFVEGIENPFWLLAKEQWPVPGYELSLKAGEDVLREASSYADNRRQRKRLAEIAALEFSIARSTDDIARVFEPFVRQKSRKYEEMGTENGLLIPHIRAYYERLAASSSETAGIQLSCLSVGDEIVATHWGMVTAKRFYYLMPAFEAGKWRRYSPGRLLMEELIKWSIANGIEAFDLGIGDEDYKAQWGAKPIALAGGKFPKTLLGRVYCAASNAKAAIKGNLSPGAIDILRRARKSIAAK